MRKIATSSPVLLSVLLVCTPLSASACDLSCWLHQTASDCHSASLAAEADQGMMSASSAMDMSSEAGTSSHVTQSHANLDHRVNASTHHLVSAQMDMVRGSRKIIQKSEESSSATFDHSRTLSPCSHETCSQASASASPPKAGGDQPAYLHCAAIGGWSPANFLTSSPRLAPGTSPPILLAVDLLTTLRI
jgi:hypothetical protein